MQQRLPVQADTICYEHINIPDDNTLPVIDGYSSISNHFFYELCKPEFREELLVSALTSSLNTNWKAHLSCTQEALPQLWGIVAPVLQLHDCPAFKCVRLCNIPEMQRNRVFGQRCVDALQFTIYIPPGEEDKYVVILQQLESLLIEHAVPQLEGVHAQLFNSDKRIGLYTSVRYTCGMDGLYLSAEQALQFHESNHHIPAYNCTGAYDPFELMDSLKEMQLAEFNQVQSRRLRPTMWQLAMQVQRDHEAAQQDNQPGDGDFKPLTRGA